MIGFFDLETGGFSITKNGICEIAMIAVDENDLLAYDQFHSYIIPYTRADDTDELVSYKDDAMAVNGLSVDELIKWGSHVKIVCERLESFIIKNNITCVIGHCSNNFDLPRIKYLFERFLGSDFMEYMLFTRDTHEIAKQKLKLPDYKLSTICQHLGIINQKEHSALGDAIATYEVYKKLMS